MTIANLTATEKKAYAKKVGQILVKRHGKQKYYSPDQVKNASRLSRYDIDWHCWAMSLYTAPVDFIAYHESIGEACDYGWMKSEMAIAITDGDSLSWFDLDLSWLEWPDFDVLSVFDIFD